MDVETSKKQTLMGKVSFVQWVMQSDVAVAQSDTNLAVWYNIDLTEHVTLLPVRGEVIDVIRDEVRIFAVIYTLRSFFFLKYVIFTHISLNLFLLLLLHFRNEDFHSHSLNFKNILVHVSLISTHIQMHLPA